MNDSSELNIIFTAANEVCCSFKMDYSIYLEENVFTCWVNQTIDSDLYVLGSALDTTVEQFCMNGIKKLTEIPKNIGEKFPTLQEFFTTRCQLTTLRNYYFKNMRNVKFLNVRENKIATIEADAFKDLVNVHRLTLTTNLIETLDVNIFATMVKLEFLNLNENKIKVLKPETFVIPGGIMKVIDLERNDCISMWYASDRWVQMASDLKANCTQ